MILHMAYAAAIAAFLALGLTPLVKKLAVWAGVVRVPRARDAHLHATPLWGGLALLAAFLVTLLLLRPLAGHPLVLAVGRGQHPILGIVLGTVLVGVMGMLDDKYDLSPKYQAGSLLLAGLIAALLGARIDGITNPFAPLPSGPNSYNANNFLSLGYFSVPITMAWVFLAAKTFDFLDGLDGLAAGVCAIASLTMGIMAALRGDAAVALLASALAGACIGFLRYNYNPASIFMGTVGSQSLGFVLAMLAVVGTFKVAGALSLLVPLLVLGVPVFDGLYVVARRVYLKQKPTIADKTHIHHRLRGRGLSVQQSVWAIYAITAAGCGAALVVALKWVH